MGVEAVREPDKEFIGAGLTAGFHQFLLGGVFVAPAQVVRNGAAEQLVLLQHHGHGIAQALQIVAAHVQTAHLHTAGGHVIQTGQQLHQTGFGAAGAADDAHRFAGGNVQIDIGKHLFAVLFIGKAHMVEFDGTVLHLGDGVLAVGEAALLAQHLGHAAGAGGGHGHHDEHHRQHHQAHEDVHAVGQHAHQFAGGEGGVARADDHLRAQPGNEQDAGINGALHEGVVEGENFFRPQQKVLHVEGGLAELLALEILPHIGLDHPDGGDVLLHGFVQVIVLFEGRREIPAGLGHDEDEAAGQNHHRHQIDGGQTGVDEEGHRHGDDHAGRGAHEHPQNHLVGVLQVGDVGGHAGDKARGGILVDVGKTEGLDVAEHGPAQVAGKAGGGLGAQHTAHDAEEQTHRRRHHHDAADAVDVAEVACGDAIVNDGGHQTGNDHLHDDLSNHHDRRQNRHQTKALCFLVQGFEHGVVFHPFFSLFSAAVMSSTFCIS